MTQPPNKSRHRYRMIYTEARTILVRDDGRKIEHATVWPDLGQWETWAEYGQNGLDASVADALFRGDRL